MGIISLKKRVFRNSLYTLSVITSSVVRYTWGMMGCAHNGMG